MKQLKDFLVKMKNNLWVNNGHPKNLTKNMGRQFYAPKNLIRYLFKKYIFIKNIFKEKILYNINNEKNNSKRRNNRISS
jgi:hypothetical protein